MSEVVFAVFLIGLGIATAPEVQKRLCEEPREQRQSKFLGHRRWSRFTPVRIIPPLKKMENK
jgi:hypothetical protein